MTLRPLIVLALVALLAPHLAFAACATPTGTAGDVIFNNTYNRMQYCDGTNWVNMGTGALGTLTAGDACTTDGTTINCTTLLGTMATQNASSVAITGGTITGLPTPTASSDAATKAYVDAATSPFCSPANVQTFLSSGTWTKPSCGLQTVIECWGGGGSGVTVGTIGYGGGGGGGGYNTRTLATARLSASITVTVGAGGVANYGCGGQAGNSTFGSWLKAFGGIGACSGNGGGGGGTTSNGTNSQGGNIQGGTAISNSNGGSSIYGGGAGGMAASSGYGYSGGDSYYGGGGGSSNNNYNVGILGGNSVYGGGGGGYGNGNGGASQFGGAGGGGTSAGSQPGGGGGAYGGAGGAGECIVTTY